MLLVLLVLLVLLAVLLRRSIGDLSSLLSISFDTPAFSRFLRHPSGDYFII